MSLTTGVISGTTSSFPRVSGDEPPAGGDYWAIRTFSPRERG